jgi:hypothetical protein
MAVWADRLFGLKFGPAAFAEHVFPPTVLVWAYCAPASDYPERHLKNYWSEVQ